jgi:hypothetical protein
VTVNPILALRAAGFTPPITNLQVAGGGITAEAGVVRATDCVFWSAYPGFIARESQFIGGDFLNLAGTIYLTGCRFFQLTMFANAIGGGGYVANLGGNIVITGCLFAYTSGFVALSGLGFLFLNGGGTMIVTGCEVATNIAVAAFFGGGIGMFTGGGVGITTGLIYSAVGSMAIACGMGFQQAVGGGVNVRTGIIQSNMGALGFGAGVGLNSYVGGGVAVANTQIHTRASALSSFYGSAVNLYVGNGVATVVNVLGGFAAGCGASAFAGGDIAVMSECRAVGAAGWAERPDRSGPSCPIPNLTLSTHGTHRTLHMHAAGWLTRALQYYGSATAVSFAVGQVRCGLFINHIDISKNPTPRTPHLPIPRNL